MRKIFLHLCVNGKTAEHKMKEFAKFLQYSAGFKVSQPPRLIQTDDLTHIFKTPGALTENRLNGLNLVGADVEWGTELSERQVDYLNSRIRA